MRTLILIVLWGVCAQAQTPRPDSVYWPPSSPTVSSEYTSITYGELPAIKGGFVYIDPPPSPTPSPTTTKVVSWPRSQAARNTLFTELSDQGYIGFVTNGTFFGVPLCEGKKMEVEVVTWPSSKEAQSAVATGQFNKGYICFPTGSWLYCARPKQ